MQFFETDRLLVRAFENHDLDDLARLTADQQVMQFVGDGNVLSRAAAEEWINVSRANVAARGYGTGAVVEKSSRALVGWAGIARPEYGGEEVIYGLAQSHWGKGLGMELVLGLVNYCVGALGRSMLRALVDARNTRSAVVLVKAGFSLEDACFEGEATHLYVWRASNSE